MLEEEVTVGKFYATFLIQDYFRLNFLLSSFFKTLIHLRMVFIILFIIPV